MKFILGLTAIVAAHTASDERARLIARNQELRKELEAIDLLLSETGPVEAE